MVVNSRLRAGIEDGKKLNIYQVIHDSSCQKFITT